MVFPKTSITLCRQNNIHSNKWQNHNYEGFDVWFKEIQSKVGMIHDNTSENPTYCHIFYHKIKSNTAKQKTNEE